MLLSEFRCLSGYYEKSLVTVAQRIDGIGVHNVHIQVTVGMIDEDVSTLLFVLMKSRGYMCVMYVMYDMYVCMYVMNECYVCMLCMYVMYVMYV